MCSNPKSQGAHVPSAHHPALTTPLPALTAPLPATRALPAGLSAARVHAQGTASLGVRSGGFFLRLLNAQDGED